MSIIQKMMNFLTPPTSKEVRASLDKESLQNIFRVCTVVLCVEVAFLLVFLIKNNPLTHEETQITYRVCICIAVCIAGVLSTKFLLGRKRLNHRAVFFIKTIFYVVFSVWAIYADCQHYIKGEQMLTLAAVEVLMVCFLLLRPWASILLTSALFVFLYFILFSIDGAAGIQSYNYLVLAIAAMTGMIVRYNYQVGMATRMVELEANNQTLSESSRHDRLTGLRNRLALDEDVLKIVGKPLVVYMCDINYFKRINDTYGHTTGDAIIRAVSRNIKIIFPFNRCYRYGGDEFLIISELSVEENFSENVFSVKYNNNGTLLDVQVSVGFVEGTARDREGLFELIMNADMELYTVKKRTHAAKNRIKTKKLIRTSAAEAR